MVILHPWAISQYRDQLDEAQSNTVGGVQPLLSMPTNGLLRTAGIKPRCGTRSERTLSTQPSSCWHIEMYVKNIKNMKSSSSI